MARRRRRGRSRSRRSGRGMFSTGKGAATVMSSHLSKQGKKGNRKPATKRAGSTQSAANRVGGYAGAGFDNASFGS